MAMWEVSEVGFSRMEPVGETTIVSALRTRVAGWALVEGEG